MFADSFSGKSKMDKSASSLHIAMYPWFAMGHITPYLQLSNKLAQNGHRISFFIPSKTKSKVEHLNHFPNLITFYPITVPHVDGLPSHAETTHDVPFTLMPLLMTAIDRTKSNIELLLSELKPNFVFFDIVPWLPNLARGLGIKPLYYSIVSPVAAAYNLSPARNHSLLRGTQVSEAYIMKPPLGFPDSSIVLHLHEARDCLRVMHNKLSEDLDLMFNRLFMCLSECEAIGVKGCREIDGPFVDYLEREFKKPVLVSGPLLPEPPVSPLDQKWVEFLDKFKPGSLIYCAFGSEVLLKNDQFQELVLGLELSGFPFLAALRAPLGSESVEEALPEGFRDRVGERGMVYGGWIQQQQILEHQSVGCFVTHCGWGSIVEGLMNKCEFVLIPNRGDQIQNARLMGNKFKAGVEVEKDEEDGFFTRESVCKAIKTVMDEDSEVAKEIRANRAKLGELIIRKDFESSYVNDFIQKLKALL